MKFSAFLLAAAAILCAGPASAQSSSPPAAPVSTAPAVAVHPTPMGVPPPPTAMPAQGMQLPDPMKIAEDRLAEVKADLKLTSEQEKSWPALEAAVKSLYKIQADQMNAMMERARSGHPSMDPFESVTLRADMMAATAQAMKDVVAAAKPLAETLNVVQRVHLADLGNLRMTRARPPGPPPSAAAQAPQTPTVQMAPQRP